MMKSNFSHVLALGFLVSVLIPTRAQPNVAPPEPNAEPPQPPTTRQLNMSVSTSDALALIGAFHNKMLRAGSYRGRVVATKTLFKEGKVVSKRTLDIESAWIGNPKQEGAFLKSVSTTIFSTTVDDKTTIEKVRIVDNGTKNYRFYESKNVWSESDQKKSGDPTLSSSMTRLAWMLALASGLSRGNQSKIERKTVDGQDRLSLQILLGNEYILDANNGNLQSWKVSSANETTEVHWLETEFDVPLPDSTFGWKTPEGATQVTPENAVFKFAF